MISLLWRVFWRAVGLFGLLLVGLLTLLVVYPACSNTGRCRIRQRWSKALLLICGVRVRSQSLDRFEGQPPSLVVLNHVSWLDIFLLTSVQPATFIAKSEIRGWPLVGWLVAGAGTLFIERASRHAVRHVNRQIIHRMSCGEHVAFFPEGTTTDGRFVGPFHTSLFAAALPPHPHDVVVMALQYQQHGVWSPKPAYIDDQTLLGSIYTILSTRGLSAELRVLEVLSVSETTLTRHQLAALTEQMVRSAVEEF